MIRSGDGGIGSGKSYGRGQCSKNLGVPVI